MNALIANGELFCPNCSTALLLIKQNWIPVWYEHERSGCEHDNTRWQVPTMTLTQLT